MKARMPIDSVRILEDGKEDGEDGVDNGACWLMAGKLLGAATKRLAFEIAPKAQPSLNSAAWERREARRVAASGLPLVSSETLPSVRREMSMTWFDTLGFEYS